MQVRGSQVGDLGAGPARAVPFAESGQHSFVGQRRSFREAGSDPLQTSRISIFDRKNKHK